MSRAIEIEATKLFSDLFRFILPNVTPENKHLLSPGELGIDYSTGVFYFCDPTTLEIRTPNSVETIQKFLDHTDPITGEFIADKLGDLRIYTHVEQIPGISDMNSVTMDTIISKMEIPSILYGHTENDSFRALELPAEDGMLHVVKLSERSITMDFYTTGNTVSYEGKYEPDKREFMYWARDDDTLVDFCISSGDGLNQTFNTNLTPEDLYVITVQFTNDTQPYAKFTINGDSGISLVDVYDNPVTKLFLKDERVQIIYDLERNRWVLADPNKSINYQQMQIIDQRIEAMQDNFRGDYKQFTTDITNQQIAYEKKMDKKQADYETYINNVQSTYEATMNKNYKDFHDEYNNRLESVQHFLTNYSYDFIVKNLVYTFTSPGKIIPIQEFDIETDTLLVNYNQTVLRPGIDYTISTDGSKITLNNITGQIGDKIQYIIHKMHRYTYPYPTAQFRGSYKFDTSIKLNNF